MEQPIINVTAVVLKYNMSSNQWEEVGSQKGTCSLSIYKSPSNEYRFIAFKQTNQEYVLNTYLFPSMLYNETTPTFHQWYDETKNAFGFNFADANDAKKFGIAISLALDTLNGSKMTQPIGDTYMPTKTTVENNYGNRTYSRKISVESKPKSSSVSPYATSQVNVSAAATTPAVSNVKPPGGAPPPPGPPPAAPLPPGPPPPAAPAAPGVSTVKKPATNDFASQLLAASQNMKSSSTSINKDNTSPDVPAPSVPAAPVGPSKPASSGPMDFLSELKFKAKNRTDPSIKKEEPIKKEESISKPSLSNKINQSSKISISTSDLSTTSYVTSADLEKFRNDLMQDILLNMEKMKNDIITSISAKLN